MIISKTINDEFVTINITKRRRQKRVIIRPLSENAFTVSAPFSMSKKRILALFETHYDRFKTMPHPSSIESHFKDQAKITIFNDIVTLHFIKGKKQIIKKDNHLYIANESHNPTIYNDQLKTYLKETLDQAIKHLITKYNPNFNTTDLNDITYKYRYLKSKFGSCQPRNLRISINLELIHYPKDCLEFIFAHEIAHLTHPNHSSQFYDFLTKLYPNHKQVKKRLNTYRQYLLYDSFTTLITALKEEATL